MPGASTYYYGMQQKDFADHHSQWQKLLQKYLELPEERRILSRYYPEFQHRITTALHLETHRVRWMDQLQNLSQAIDLPSLHYEIAQAIPWTHSGTKDSMLFMVTMQLRIGMLHEIDLLRVLHDITHYPDAWARPVACRLQRVGNTLRQEQGQANIDAECTLHWVGFMSDPGGEV